MSSLVAFGNQANSGDVQSESLALYATARTGGTLSVLDASAASLVLFGQQNVGGTDYACTEAFWEFDTSSIGSGQTVSSAVMATEDGGSDFSGHSAVCQARLYDYGTSMTTADWISGASISANTLLCHLASGSLGAGSYVNWVDDAFAANVNMTGKTRIVLDTDRFEAGTAPGIGTSELAIINFPNDGVNQPKLTITYAAAASTVPLRCYVRQAVKRSAVR